MLAGKENPSSLTLEMMMWGLGRMVAFPRVVLTDKGFGVDATAMSLPIADRLAFLMREEIASTGETQLQLANRAGVSRFYIRKTLHGEANPSLLSLEKMLKGIGAQLLFPSLPRGHAVTPLALRSARRQYTFVSATQADGHRDPEGKSSLAVHRPKRGGQRVKGNVF